MLASWSRSPPPRSNSARSVSSSRDSFKDDRLDLKGGTAVENAQILRDVLAGKLQGPVTDTVILNAGAGLYVAGAAAL